ncbi:MAG: hypothetical protein J1E81_07580 [Eubacterium sp.]|nr:hypothetical protein [Eubacterium sp.]
MQKLKKLLRRLFELAEHKKEIPLEKHRDEFMKWFANFIDSTICGTDEED